jgi:hypothetical protein
VENNPKEEWEAYKSLASRLYGDDRTTDEGRSIWLKQPTTVEPQNTSLLDKPGSGIDLGNSGFSSEGQGGNGWLSPDKPALNQQHATESNGESTKFDSRSDEQTDPFQLAKMTSGDEGKEYQGKYVSPVPERFLDKVGLLESTHRYYVTNTDSDGSVHYGKYQLGVLALKDSGFLNMDGTWSDKAKKYGVNNYDEFLKNGVAQEHAMADFVKKLDVYLKHYGLHEYVDGIIHPGANGKSFSVTAGGMVAAAHRKGIGDLIQYLKFQRDNGWKSDFSGLTESKKESYLAIETRLLQFQNLKHK